MIGDDFTSASFDQYVKDVVRGKDLFLTTHFEVEKYAAKSYCTHVCNVLARIKLQFAKAINKNVKLPKYCVFVLDDDIIRHTKINEESASIMLNKMIPWLMKEIHKLVDIRKNQLPAKAVRDNFPMIYWMEAPQHIHFKNNMVHRKFNSVVQSETSRYQYMRIARMKKVWDAEDKHLFYDGRFTPEGLMKYWGSIDNAIEFNIKNKFKSTQMQKGEFLSGNNRDRFHWMTNVGSQHHRNQQK